MKEKIWIVVKTYPTFSKKYFELVCTAGINEKGEWRRLYPIPFRQKKQIEKYKKYQWIEASIERNTSDPRPESYKLKGEISITSLPLDTKNNWEKRKRILEKVPIFQNKEALIKKAHKNELSLAVFKPAQIRGFAYEATERDWSQDILKRIEEENSQLPLFQDFKKEIQLIKKLPYKFFYTFVDNNGKESSLMIEDWEIGALYWNCLKRHHNDEQKAVIDVKNKYEGFISKNEILLFLGTTKEFHIRKSKNPFVIIGVFYPPKPENS